MARRMSATEATECLRLFPKATRDHLRRMASTRHPGTLLGPPGSGKSVAASCVHALSARAPMEPRFVNVAALSADLVDRELFGHAKGAFTSAVTAAKGLIEAAHKSTLVLEEIGDLRLDHQAKLLDVLESATVRRIGETFDRAVDVRFLFTTNSDLPSMLEEGRFRRDLFDRIGWHLIWVPPLARRLGDIPYLVRHFVERLDGGSGSSISVSDGALALLSTHTWPGNVRELELVIARATTIGEPAVITRQDVEQALAPQREIALRRSVRGKRRYVAPSPEEEAHNMRQALSLERGNVTRAARRLGMAASTFWGKMKVYRLHDVARQLRRARGELEG